MDDRKVECPSGFEGVSRVVAHPLRFKAQLGIGEDAYTSLMVGRTAADIWHVGTASAAGGMVAGSSTVATSFFGSWLTVLGIGAALTPVGWVIGGAAAAGALSWGVIQSWRSYSGSRVEVVPKFINTPIDFLAASLFDLVAGLSILVARETGEVEDAERAAIADYFTSEWGIAPEYIAAALPLIEENSRGKSVSDAAKALAEYKLKNPDCNYEAMSAEVLRFLTEIGEADGILDDAEKAAISEVGRIFAAHNSWGAWDTASLAASYVTGAPGALWQMASGMIWSSPKDDAKPEDLLKPEELPSLPKVLPVPTLWLLGKTGAGKSSLVQALTKTDGAEIGNGFSSCTRTSKAFDYPQVDPVMRFLDTRGLGEVDYDPSEDLAVINTSANVALIVMRLDDPAQGAIAVVLANIRTANRKLPIIVVHTGSDLVTDDSARVRVQSSNQRVIEKAWGATLPSVTLDLSEPAATDLSALAGELVKILPCVVMFLDAENVSNDEEAEFAKNHSLILGYARGAAATGAVPLVGAFSVPALQLAMLSALAGRYEVEWSTRRLAELCGALGTGILGGQAMAFAAREASKLVPVVGQTVAPVASAAWGFASTWALGRVAAWWLYKLRAGHPIDEGELRSRFAAAMKGAGRDPG